MRRASQAIILVLLSVIAIAALWIPRESGRVRGGAEDKVTTARTLAIEAPPLTDPLEEAYRIDGFFKVMEAQKWTEIAMYVSTVRAFVATIPTPAPATVRLPPASGGGGSLSQEQLTRLARCESGTNPYAGDPSPWRTGYWGIEAGYAMGSMSLAEQEAWVQRIYAQHGASAWGCGGVL